MNSFSRLGLICVLLGGLAYGSYAFGRYFLSNKLFEGKTVVPTDQSGLAVVSKPEGPVKKTRLRGKPQVDVQILPANDAGPGPEPPPLADPSDKEDSEKSSTSDRATTKKLPSNPSDPSNLTDGDPLADGLQTQPTPEVKKKKSRKRRRQTTDDTLTLNDGLINPDAVGLVTGDVANDGTTTLKPKKKSHRHRERPATSSNGETSVVPRPESSGSGSHHGGTSGGDSDSPVPRPE